MKIGLRTSVELLLLIILCTIKCNGSSFGGRKEIQDSSQNVGITVNIGIVDVSSELNRNVGNHNEEFSSGNRAEGFSQPQDNFGHQGGLSLQNQRPTGSFNSYPGGYRRPPSHSGGAPPPSLRPHEPNSFGQSRPSPLPHNSHPHYHQQLSSDIYFDNGDRRVTEISSQRPNNYNTNIPESITKPKPLHKEIYSINVPASGQQIYVYSNGELGQNSHQGNDALSSTGHDSSNRAGDGQNTGNLNSQGHINGNGYGGQISHNFDGNNDDSPTRRPIGTTIIYHDLNKRPVENERNPNRRPVASSVESGIRRPGSSGESSLVGTAKPLAAAATATAGSRYTTTMRPTTKDYYDVHTSTARPARRTTPRPNKQQTQQSSGGCFLPEQPRGGHYELGNCDPPCEKKPGDLVPNTSVLTYTCDEGFVRNGSAVSVCLNDTWYMPPSCLRTCPPLKSISVDIICKHRGNIVPCDEAMEPGTRANLACKPSYKIPLTEDPAYREITCMKDGLWDRRLFRCLPKCGTTIAHGNTLVVNGFTAKVGVFPWHVGIYEKKSRRVYEQICAGTLINSNLVVSAAHCFYDETNNQVKDSSKYYVAAGKHYRSWDTEENYVQKSKIETITVPDRYIGARGNFAQDIALLELKIPFELTGLVRPVCLDWDNVLEREHLQVNHYGKAVGWGKTASGQPSEELQEINVPFVPFDQCLSDVPSDFRGYITPDKFCAGYLNGSSLCEGDSGGGLCFESNGLWYLRGIISVSPVRDYSCDYNSYTGFTYFSHFREWVRSAFLKS